MGFFLYKGLKKPLILFGLKDKYIYYAMGIAFLGIVCAATFSTIFGSIGTIGSFGLTAGAIGLIFKIQDRKGLYNKTKNTGEIHIFPKKFKNKKLIPYSIENEEDKNF